MRPFLLIMSGLLLLWSVPGCLPTTGSALVVQGDMVVLTLPLRATQHQIDSISSAFSLQDLNLAAYLRDGNAQTLRANGWQLVQQNATTVVWQKPLATFYGGSFTWKYGATIANNTFYPQADFGVNQLTDRHIRSHNGYTTFVFRDGGQAQRVVLSGSFNGWSVNNQPMIATDSGWVLTLPLPPGKHLYKWIVDGKWMHDTANPLTEDDTHDGFNSVYFVENQIFSLKQPQLAAASLTGSFLGWNAAGIPMHRTSNGWELPVYLAAGTHTYQFIADGKRITDPANPRTSTLPDGQAVSVMGTGTAVKFVLKNHQQASNVILAGNFNDWSPFDAKMVKINDQWEYTEYLGPGIHQYKFIADGQWITDPANPLQIGHEPLNNSVLILQPNYTFVFQGFTGAKSVRVTGDFIAWDRVGLPMQRTATGWMLPVWLEPGKHSYSFLVDGHPVRDPNNPLWEEFGRPNSSVLWVPYLALE